MVVWERYEGDTSSKWQQGTSKKPEAHGCPGLVDVEPFRFIDHLIHLRKQKRHKHFELALVKYCIWLILASSSQLFQSDPILCKYIQVRYPGRCLSHINVPIHVSLRWLVIVSKKSATESRGTSLALRVTRCFTTSKVPQSPKDLFFWAMKNRDANPGLVMLWTYELCRGCLACHEINFIQSCFLGGVENLYALQSSRHIFAQRQDHWGPQCTLEQS